MKLCLITFCFYFFGVLTNGYVLFPYPSEYQGLTGRQSSSVPNDIFGPNANPFSSTYSNNPFATPFATLTSLTGIRPLSSYLPRYATQDDVTALTKKVKDLLAAVKDITNPRCTPDAITYGAQLVNNLCLSVETVSKSYYDAKMKCFDQGGKLAEPSFNYYNFYRDLSAAFSEKMTGIGQTPIYLGISGTVLGNCSCSASNVSSEVFAYNTNGFQVPSTNNIWLTPESPGPGFMNVNVTQAAFLVPPSSGASPWRLNRENIMQTTSRPFICQYDVI